MKTSKICTVTWGVYVDILHQKTLMMIVRYKCIFSLHSNNMVHINQ